MNAQQRAHKPTSRCSLKFALLMMFAEVDSERGAT